MHLLFTVWVLILSSWLLYYRAATVSYEVRGSKSDFFPLPALAIDAARPTLFVLGIIGASALFFVSLAPAYHHFAQTSGLNKVQGLTHAYTFSFVLSSTVTGIHGSSQLWLGKRAANLKLDSKLMLWTQAIIAFVASAFLCTYYYGMTSWFQAYGLAAETPLWSNLFYFGIGSVIASAVVLSLVFGPRAARETVRSKPSRQAAADAASWPGEPVQNSVPPAVLYLLLIAIGSGFLAAEVSGVTAKGVAAPTLSFDPAQLPNLLTATLAFSSALVAVLGGYVGMRWRNHERVEADPEPETQVEQAAYSAKNEPAAIEHDEPGDAQHTGELSAAANQAMITARISPFVGIVALAFLAVALLLPVQMPAWAKWMSALVCACTASLVWVAMEFASTKIFDWVKILFKIALYSAWSFTLLGCLWQNNSILLYSSAASVLVALPGWLARFDRRAVQQQDA